ncbi:NlpC/P60 family protein [Nakamurella deserti]|uniref:C40 family peptidase n=1 Tax=Nakamurella deserti TaxID=2164074 RepID=UPI001300771E|nr:NlpC/P60 family protein [Nakamurella deserti]
MRRAPARTLGIGAGLVIALVLGLAAPAGALPPPPENPTDDQIAASQNQAAEINTAVGQLSAQVASTQGQIDALRNDMQLKQELSQKAAIDLDIAQADAADAATAAEEAAAVATAAQGDISTAQDKADSFAAASFRQGSTLGSMTALWDAGSADELLQRNQLLESISGSQLDVIGNLQRAQVTKSNLDAAAREALQKAKDAAAAADAAKQAADRAAADAADALQVGQAQLVTLQNDLSNQQVAYQAAVNTVNALQGQRQAYEEWLVLKAAEEERLRKEAEEAARKAAEEEAARQAAAAAAAAAEAARVAAEQEAQRQAAAAAAEQAAAAERQAARNAQAAAAAAAAQRSADAAAASAAAASAAAPRPAAAKPTTTQPAPSTPTPAYSGDIGQQVVAAAKKWLGTKYVWAGGNANGPTGGGFDCSGLMLYAYAQVGINMPHYSGYQYYEGSRVAKSDLRPGDLVFYAYDTSDPKTIHHVAMYIGDGQMIEAPYTGSWVRIMPLRTSDYIGASRPYA